MIKKNRFFSEKVRTQILFLGLILLLGACQIGKRIPVELSQNQQNTLVVISNVNCGYCRAAMKKMLPLSPCDNLDIIVLEGGTKKEIEKIYSSYLDDYQFIEYDSLNVVGHYNQKLFPQFFLYDSKGKQIWKTKGVNRLDATVLSDKIGCESK